MKSKPSLLGGIALAFAACVITGLCYFANSNERVDERLAVFVDCEIASHHQSKYSAGNFCCLDWEVLGAEQRGDRTTLYLWVLYEEFIYDEELMVDCGAHVPTVITVEQTEGGYRLVEYWEPEDGEGYAPSIKEKFPMHLWGKAVDSQWIIEEQSAELRQMAMEHFGLDAA